MIATAPSAPSQAVDLSAQKLILFRSIYDATQNRLPIFLPIERLPIWFQSLLDPAIEQTIFPFEISATGSSTAYAYVTTEQTTSTIPDWDFMLLDELARTENLPDFITTLNKINWDVRSAQDINRAIRLALSIGAHAQARRLIDKGIQRYPDNKDLEIISNILAPAKVVSHNLPSDPSAAEDMEWLKNNSDAYRGKWVALQSGQLLASASSAIELKKIVGDTRGKGILLSRVY